MDKNARGKGCNLTWQQLIEAIRAATMSDDEYLDQFRPVYELSSACTIPGLHTAASQGLIE